MIKRLGKTVVCAIPAMLFAATPALAEDLSYDYVEIRYLDTEIDAGGFCDIDGKGFEIGGSLAIADNWHVFGGFQSLGFDFDVDGKSFEIGAGYMQPIAPAADVVARVSYVDGEIDTAFGDADDSGFGIALGVRQAFGPSLEGSAFVKHVNLDESGNETSLALLGEVFPSEELAIGLTLEFGDDTTTWGIGARYYFNALR